MRKDRTTVAQTVPPFPIGEFDFVSGVFKGSGHRLVCLGPAPKEHIRIGFAALEENPNRFAFRGSHPERVFVAAANIGKRSAVAEDAAKGIRSMPGSIECADAAAADTADRSPLRVIGQTTSDMVFHCWQYIL